MPPKIFFHSYYPFITFLIAKVMSFNVAGSSTRIPSDLPLSDLSLSDLSLPTVEEVKGFNVEQLNGFLKKKLKNIDSHIDTLTAQEVDGEAFLTLTHEGLKVSGIPLGASTKIIKLLNDIQGGKRRSHRVIFVSNTEYLLNLVLFFPSNPPKKHIHVIVYQPAGKRVVIN